MRSTCQRCGRRRGAEDCVCDICRRCLCVKCICERRSRKERYEGDDKKYQLDEDVADDLRRDYGIEFDEYGDRVKEEPTTAYWHGYNAARKHRFVTCPYTNTLTRKDFWRGVSDRRRER